MKIAAIDIGSNSIKLLVADSLPGGRLVPLKREKEVVRLGHETLLNGQLSSEAIVRATQCIGRMKTISHHCEAEQILAMATASVREASNASQFIREVNQRTGVRIEVLSGVEEARLIGLAATTALDAKNKTLFNVDIGGGSTELSLMRNGKPRSLFSMKVGAVRLTEQFVSNDPPKPKELLNLRQEVRGALEHPLREIKHCTWDEISGTSGTILAIGAALKSVAYPDAETVESAEVPSMSIERKMLESFNSRIASMPARDRKKLPGISEQRAEIIVAGGIILEETMRAFKIKRLHTCQWSLREGLILDRTADLGGSVRGKETDPRLAGAEALGERFNYEAGHGKHVSHLARLLFDQLRSLHQLSGRERTLLAAGALLHDIGYAISHEAHHKHSLYMILHSELTGFTDLERQMIGNIARYHRKALPKVTHPHFSSLSEQDQRIVWQLGGIVRLADALDRSHQSRVRDMRLTIHPDHIAIKLSAVRSCDHEIWAADKKKGMFEQIFGRTVRLVQA